MRPYMCKAYQFRFNIEKYFIFLKTTHLIDAFFFSNEHFEKTCFFAYAKANKTDTN